MKLLFSSTLSVAAATATALVTLGAPAQAASFLGIDIVEDSPVTGTAPTIPHQTNAFLGDGLTYEFSVMAPDGLGSRGLFYSDFGFMSNKQFTALFMEGEQSYDIANSAFINDWQGTCNVTITAPCTVEYTFEKDVEYQFGVWERGFSGNATPQFRTFGVAQLDSFKFPGLTDQAPNNPIIEVSDPGYYFIGMEDTRFPLPNGDFYYDFQDWVVKAKAPESVPEPATVGALLGLGALGFISRRRKAVKR
ncbi:MAG: PEP-CTERM sorting domain-containing protein [Coleofasciculus chthonoplastes F3-SA18-01]|uniref:PEP-CTERM sorting domain-containing protein n=1 Tax=Coleofasciculus chthonoplastes TaxID=64178 RepID=UPI0032FB3AF0